MTNEEAIVYWEGLRRTFHDHMEKEENPFGKKHYRTSIEAIDAALSALRPVSREQVEKVWRGEWVVQMDGNGYLYKNMVECSRCKTTHIGYPNVGRFCPHCGAPMTDEAVDILLKRLEALHEEN